MEKNLVGYRFYPTGEELINHYLKNKLLGKSWLVDDAISEINICNYEPMFLPSLSKLKSDDPVWYFFSPKEYTSAKKKVMKRTTSSGYWKATGVDRKIKDKRGNRGEIGIKKTLVYYDGRVPNGVWTPWVMHEYHITCLPHDQRSYVICQVMYKGEDGDIPSAGNNSSMQSQSLVSDSNTFRAQSAPLEVDQPGGENYGLSESDLLIPMTQQEDRSLLDPNTLLSDNNNPNVQSQTPYFAQDDDEFLSGLKHVNRGQVEHLFSDLDSLMQLDYNDYRPKKSLSGIIVDYNTDSDAESISEMSYQETSSPRDSVGSSYKHLPSYRDEILSSSTYYSCKDVKASAKPSIRRMTRESKLTRSKQELKQVASRAVDASIDKGSSFMVKTENKGWFITEEAMERNRKNPPYVYLMNIIIGFILLVVLISNILSVLLSFKT